MKIGDLVKWRRMPERPDEFGIVIWVDEKLGFFKFLGYPDNQMFTTTGRNLEVVSE
jgi:hypothetical protein